MNPLYTTPSQPRSFRLFLSGFFLSFLILFSGWTALHAQTFTNGNLSTGALNSVNALAPSGYTWSEVQAGNINLGFNARSDSFAVADNFTVTCGPWTTTKFTFYTYITGYNGSVSPVNDVRVAIYNGNPSAGGTLVFGNLTTNRFSSSFPAFVYRVANGSSTTDRQVWQVDATVNTVLNNGTYWVVFTLGNNLPATFFPAPRCLVPPSTLLGTTTQPGNNAQQLTIPSNTWGALSDLGGPQDIPFGIQYTTPACVGTPTPGNTVSTATSICPSLPFTLSLQNPTCGLGISHQWQSAPAPVGPWTNINNANSSTLTSTLTALGLPSGAYFRDNVVCSGNAGPSVPIQVNAAPLTSCYCIPGATVCSADDDIRNVTYFSLNNSSSDCVNSGYSDFTSIVGSPFAVLSGVSRPISVTVAPGGFESVAVWIDYNQNGIFESSEFTFIGSGFAFNNPRTFTSNITIPVTALNGVTRMRVRSRYNINLTAGDACVGYDFGQTEDYQITISAAPSCAGTPTAASISSSVSSVCPNVSFTLSVNNSNSLGNAAGLTFEWQSSTDGVTWNTIPGATGFTYTTTQATSTQYRFRVTCSNSALSSTSNVVVVNMSPASTCYCVPTSNGADNDIITNVTFGCINNNSGIHLNGAGYSDYTTTTWPAPLNSTNGVGYRGVANPISVRSLNAWEEYLAVWIDYNQSGTFDTNEYTFIGTTAPAVGPGPGAIPIVLNTNISIPATALLGVTRMRVRCIFAFTPGPGNACTNYAFGETEDYLIDIRNPVSCAGTIAVGALISSETSVCLGENVSIYPNNACDLTGLSGASFQWQSSTDGGINWVSIPGPAGTLPTLNITVIGTTLFRLQVVCGAANGTSPTTSVSLTPASGCYCVSGASVSNNSDISNVTLSTLNNTSDCNSAAPGSGSITNQYSNYTSGAGAPAAPIIYSGTSNAFSVSLISCVGSAQSGVAVWIDLNKNGIFEELGGYTEKLYVSAVTSGAYPRTENGFLTIPTLNNLGDTIRGVTRMRVVNQATNSAGSISPCGIYNYGETEDYLVDIRYAPVCNAAFVPTIVASANPVCPSVPFTLTVTNATGLSGLSYQWQVSTDGGVTYADIAGAINTTYTTNITAARCYRVISTCGPSATVDTSTAICVAINTNPLQCYCIPAASTAGTVYAITNVTFGGINNTTSWVTPGYTYYPTPIGSATRDANNNISVTVSSGGSGTYYLACWIDFNQNGQFETTEYRGLGTTTTGSTVNTSINVPATATAGVTRMRIRLSRGASIGDNNACTTITNGETEDYQVNINNCVPVDFEGQPSNSIITCGSNGGFQVSATSASGTPTYQWLVRTTPTGAWTPLSNGPIYGGVTTPSLVITAPPISYNGYEYRVAVGGSCSTPDSSSSASLVINSAGANVVTTEPSNVSANCGANATFTFAAAVGAGAAYQWQVRPNAAAAWANITNVAPFSGATTTSLTVSGLTNGLNGYQFRAYVTSTCNTADTTTNAILTVNPITLSVSITSTSQPSNVICNGSSVTFTAATTSSAAIPPTAATSWYIDNIATASAASTGTTINVVSTAQLTAGMKITVVGGTGSFASGTTVASITNATQFVASATPVLALQAGAIISGEVASGVGVNTYITSSLRDGNSVRASFAVFDPTLCTSPNPASSNVITVSVTPNTTASVDLVTASSSVCANTPVLFTANPTNGGTNPSYLFLVGNTPVQGPSASNTYTTSALTNGQIVKVRMTSNATNCPAPLPASDSITMTVNPSFPVSVTLSANPGGSGDTINICGGIPIEFTATAVNPGASPNYKFRVNGAVVQNSASNTFITSGLSDNDVVDCVLTSSIGTCAPGNPDTSNVQVANIEAQTATVDLTFSPNPACAGSTVTYTATPANGGSTPSYLFYVNGILQSTTGNTFAYVPSEGDSVSVEMASSLPCALPNPATDFVIQSLQISPTATISVSTLTCSSGSATLDAGAVAGSGTITGIQWQLASANIAGATGATYFTTTGGSYTVAVTNSNGCTFTSAPFSLTIGTAGPLSGVYTIGAITATNVSGSTTTLTCASTANLTVGAILTKVSGTGTLAANTVITGILNATQFTVNVAPTAALSAAAIAGTTCTNYISIAAAVADLNTRTINGNCTFNVPAGYVENLTARIDLGSVALNSTLAGRTVTFQKSGAGANPVLNAYTGTGTPSVGVADGMWALSGADNITIDGINLFDGNTSNWMEYGYGFFKLNISDGAQNNTIRNCKISLKRENNAAAGALVPEGSTGILFNNSTSAAPNTGFGGTVAAGSNSNNKIYSDSIINCNNGIALVGYGAVSPFTDGDTGNDIGGISIATGNTILNFGGGGANAASGIRALNQWGLIISYNKIDNNLLPGGANHAGPLTGIRGIAGTSANVTINNNDLNIKGGGNFAVSAIENTIGSTPAGNTVNINNNTVTGSNTFSTTATYFAIQNNALAANLNMNGNTVSGFTFPASSGEWRGIYNSVAIGTSLNMNSNTITGNTINSTNAACRFLYTIGSATLTTASMSNNAISNNTRPVSAAAASQLDYILFSSSANCNLTASGNTISNNVVNIATTGAAAQTINGMNFGITNTLLVNNNTIQNIGANINIAAGVVNVRGLALLAAAAISENVSGNTIDQLYVKTTNATASTSIHVLDGIVSTGGNGSRNFFNNTISNIYTASNYTSQINGIRNAAGSLTLNIYRNRIFNLFPGQSATAGSYAYGIRLSNIAANGTANIYNNMISIDLTNAAAPAANGVLNASDGLRGIDVSGTTLTTTYKLYNNTVRLAGTGSAAGAFGSSALYHAASATATTASLELINNIFVNECTKQGAGFVTAYRRSAANTFGNYATTSKNNNFYVTSAANHTIVTDGNVNYTTLAAFTSAAGVSPRETGSISVQPVFVSNTDLHLQSCGGGNAALDGTGSNASLTLAPNDFDDEVRNNPPDIGADEFNGNSFSGRVQTSTTACPGINSGTLNLTGASGTVTTWEFSTDSTNWTPIAATAGLSSYSYSNLTVKTWFRAQVENATCAATQPSIPASVSVFLRPQISLTNGGADTTSVQVCTSSSLNLFGNGTAAVVNPWVSTNTTILTISNGGVVAAQSVGGPVDVIYTNNNGCKDTVAVTVNALPSISGTLTACAGVTTTVLTGSTSPLAAGTTWNSSNPSVATVSGNLSTTSVNALAAGTTNITYTSSAGCVSAPVIFTVNARPVISLTSGGASAASTSLCASSSANLFGTPTANATNPWLSSNTAVLAINGSGFMTASSTTGASTVTYTNSNSCTNTITVNVIASPNITGTLSACAGTNSTVLTGSGTPAASNTWASSNPAVATVSGNLVTTSVNAIAAGTTTITYTNSVGCQKSVIFTVNPQPTAFAVTGGGSYCFAGTGVSIGLAGSQSGVNYQLVRQGTPNVNVGAPVAGNTSPISFGLQTVAGTYIVTAVNTTTGCTQTMTGNATVTVNALPVISGDLSVCSGGTSALTGNPGPAASNAWQISDPTVATINTTGEVTAIAIGTATITYTDVNGCVQDTLFTVSQPSVAGTASGSTAVCTNLNSSVISVSGNTGGVQWQSSPDGVTFANIPGATNVTYTAVNLTADTYYQAVVTNGGCTPDTTNSVVINVNPLPAAFNVTGTGAICAGSNGRQIGLSGSQTGVRYQLVLSPATNVGSPVTGTGAAISFGTFATAGTYTVTATNNFTLCSETMTGSAVITVNPLPTDSISPTGQTVLCEGSTQVLTANVTNAGAASYKWYKDGVLLAGATSSTYTVTSAVGSSVYQSVVTNNTTGCVSLKSKGVVVSFVPDPTNVTVSPDSSSICSGGAGQSLVASADPVANSSIALLEDFNGSTPWTVSNSGTSPAVSNWAIATTPYNNNSGTAQFTSFYTQDSGRFALADADAGGSGSNTLTALISPSFSLVNYTDANLNFEHVFRQLAGDTARVDVSTDGGTTWTTIRNYTSNAGIVTSNAQATVNDNISMDAFVNQANVRVRFYYRSSWGYFWILDNIRVTGTKQFPLTYTWSPAAGLSATTGASVTANPASSTVYTVTASTANGCSNTGTAEVNIIANPVINSITPAAANICVTGTQEITVNISGDALTYSWRKNGVPVANGGAISGQGTPTLTLTNPTAGDAGNYTVVVEGTCGVPVTSTACVVTVTANGTWLGINNLWADANNWCGGVPTPTTDCVIPVTPTGFYPVILSNAPEARNVVVSAGASLTVKGKIKVYGSITNSGGVIDVKEGTLEMGGSAAQTIPANAFQNNNIRNLVINNASVTLLGNLNLLGKLSFTGSNRTFNTGGFLTLKSSDTLTASVGDITNNNTTSGNQITGDVQVERYLSGWRAWRFLSMPTKHNLQTIKEAWQENQPANNNTLSSLGLQLSKDSANWNTTGFDIQSSAGGPSVKFYQNGTWKGITSTINVPGISNGRFELGKAYMTFFRGDRTVNSFNPAQTTTPSVLREKGEVYTGNYGPISVPSGQFVAIGNPYASAINFANFDRTNIDGFYYLWDPKIGALGAYQTFTTSGNCTPCFGSYGDPNVVGAVHPFIESGQGFFVRNSSASAGSVTIRESSKADSNYLVSRQALNNTELRANLFISPSGNRVLYDGVLSIFDPVFANGVDAEDVAKLTNFGENLSLIRNGSLLSIEQMGHPQAGDTLFYRIGQLRQQAYQFEFTPKLMDQFGLKAELEDLYLNTRTDISLTAPTVVSFAITSDAASAQADRFRIVFRPLAPVPVTFVDVRAERKDRTHLVSWNVQNELNIRQYTVERSADGRTFNAIGQVAANGSAAYALTDLQPVWGDNFYRIRSSEVSGQYQYSKVVKLTYTGVPEIAMSPNPVNEDRRVKLSFRDMPGGTYQLRILNALGQVVQTRILTHTAGTAVYDMELSGLSAHGSYHAEVRHRDSGTMTLLKFVF